MVLRVSRFLQTQTEGKKTTKKTTKTTMKEEDRRVSKREDLWRVQKKV